MQAQTPFDLLVAEALSCKVLYNGIPLENINTGAHFKLLSALVKCPGTSLSHSAALILLKPDGYNLEPQAGQKKSKTKKNRRGPSRAAKSPVRHAAAACEKALRAMKWPFKVVADRKVGYKLIIIRQSATGDMESVKSEGRED